MTKDRDGRAVRMAKTKAERRAAAAEQIREAAAAAASAVATEPVLDGRATGEPAAGRFWVDEAADLMKQGDGEWVLLGEHVTRQSAEHGRARLRRRLRADGVATQFDLWVTVDRERISAATLRRGDQVAAAAEQAGLPRPKMRRPAAIYGRWLDGRIEASGPQQRVAGQAGGAATRAAQALRRDLAEAAGSS